MPASSRILVYSLASSMPGNESKSSENPEPISPGGDHGHQEGEGVPSDGHEPGDPSVGSTAEPVSLYSALVEVCGREKYPDQEVGVLACPNAARTGRVRPTCEPVTLCVLVGPGKLERL